MNDGNELEAFRLPLGSAPVAHISGNTFRTTSKKRRERIPRQQGAFIRGPIPLVWLDVVLKLPGPTTLRVTLALFYQSGLQRSSTVRFTRPLMKRFRVDPRSASRTLQRMQAAGLVRVHQKAGRCREVELLNVKGGVSIANSDA